MINDATLTCMKGTSLQIRSLGTMGAYAPMYAWQPVRYIYVHKVHDLIDIMLFAQKLSPKTHHRSLYPWIPHELLCLCVHGNLFDTFISTNFMI